MRTNQKIFEAAGKGCYLNVEIIPGTEESQVIGVDNWRRAIRFHIAAQPISGEANRELIKYLENIMPEVKGEIRIVAGERSRRKRIFIPLGAETIKKYLGVENDL